MSPSQEPNSAIEKLAHKRRLATALGNIAAIKVLFGERICAETEEYYLNSSPTMEVGLPETASPGRILSESAYQLSPNQTPRKDSSKGYTYYIFDKAAVRSASERRIIKNDRFK